MGMRGFAGIAALVVAAVGAVAGLAKSATADTNGPIDFESYTLGNINGQQGWTKTGPYDVAVADVTGNSFGFGTQALRLSDATTSGSFGDKQALTQSSSTSASGRTRPTSSTSTSTVP